MFERERTKPYVIRYALYLYFLGLSLRGTSSFVIDETQIQIGSDEAWLWVAIEPIHQIILGVYISRHRNMLVAESFLRSLVKLYGRQIVYSDGGTWYPEACLSLGLKHRLHSSFEKSIIERAMEYVKDRTENFDDYYPCRKKSDCNLNHVYRWFVLFILLYNLSKLSFASSDANVFSLVTSRSKKMSIDQSAITLSFFSIVGRLAK